MKTRLYEPGNETHEENQILTYGKPAIRDSVSINGTIFFDQLVEESLPERSSIRPRAFDFDTLVYVVSGSGWYWNEKDGRQPLYEQQLIVIPRNYVHDFAASK